MSLTEAMERVGVDVDDATSGCTDAVTVLTARHELAHRSPGCFLHRDALGIGAIAQCRLLIVGQSERHRHVAMVSIRYRREVQVRVTSYVWWSGPASIR